MGAVFRLQDIIARDNQGVRLAKLELTGGTNDRYDKELRRIAEDMRDLFEKPEDSEQGALTVLGKLMHHMKRHDIDEMFHITMLRAPQLTKNWRELCSIHYQLGQQFNEMGRNEDTIGHYKKAVEIGQEHFGSTDISLAITYNNLGATYYLQKNYKRALECFKQALIVYLATPIPDQSGIVDVYNNVGQLYNAQKHYDDAAQMISVYLTFDGDLSERLEEALVHAKLGMEIRLKHYPSDHVYVKNDRENIEKIEAEIAQRQKPKT